MCTLWEGDFFCMSSQASQPGGGFCTHLVIEVTFYYWPIVNVYVDIYIRS